MNYRLLDIKAPISSIPNQGQIGSSADMSIAEDQTDVAFGKLLVVGQNGLLRLAKSDTDALMPVTFMATGSGVGLQTVIKPDSVVRYNSQNWTINNDNKFLQASDTAGAITETQPTATGIEAQIVGMIITTNIILFRPTPVLVEVTA